MPAHSTPEVSVVIPSTASSRLDRAVASALDQRGVDLEVIVVLNNPVRDVEFADERVRVLHSDGEQRGNGARNVGIAAARARYVALLDDDDYWHPQKLRHQLDYLESLTDGGSGDGYVVVGCALEERHPDGAGRRVSPRKPEPIDEVRSYLFRRAGLIGNLTQLQTSTLVFPAELGRSARFDPALRYHQDWSWLLAAQAAGARFAQLDEPLCYREISGSDSVGGRISWEQSAGWAMTNITDDRLIGDFLLIMALPKALRRGDTAGARAVFRMARNHRPGLSSRAHAAITYTRWSWRYRLSRRGSAAASTAMATGRRP